VDYTKLIEEVITKAKPVRPNCSVCGGVMQSAEWDAQGKELLVCSRIKPNNQMGDARVYDPQHYEKSKVRIAINVDMALLRRHLAEAFGKVEAETEGRVLEAYRKPAQAVPPVIEKPAPTPMPSGGVSRGDADLSKGKKKADVAL
jgi:ssDNA-binding Zn-finger/Zn-ribbon topoisomerase 1